MVGANVDRHYGWDCVGCHLADNSGGRTHGDDDLLSTMGQHGAVCGSPPLPGVILGGGMAGRSCVIENNMSILTCIGFHNTLWNRNYHLEDEVRCDVDSEQWLGSVSLVGAGVLDDRVVGLSSTCKVVLVGSYGMPVGITCGFVMLGIVGIGPPGFHEFGRFTGRRPGEPCLGDAGAHLKTSGVLVSTTVE